MARRSDSALAYLERLHICPAKDSNEFHAKVKAELGGAVYEQFTNVFDEIASIPGSDKNDAYYAFKNQSEHISRTISGLWDGDIYRMVCSWVYEHRACFGKTVLDIGCDNGIISCFIAGMLPASRITGIDKCRKAVIIAGRTAKQLGIGNIQFDLAEAGRYDPGYLFDSVISIRTVHENFTKQNHRMPVLAEDEARCAANQMHAYAKCLTGHVAPSGNLITIERFERRTGLLGWLTALKEESFSLDRRDCDRISVQEVDMNSNLYACTLVRHNAGFPPFSISSS